MHRPRFCYRDVKARKKMKKANQFNWQRFFSWIESVLFRFSVFDFELSKVIRGLKNETSRRSDCHKITQLAIEMLFFAV